MQSTKNRWAAVVVAAAILLLIHFTCGSPVTGGIHQYASTAFGNRISAAQYGSNGLPLFNNEQNNASSAQSPVVSTPSSLFPTGAPPQQ